MIFNLKSNLCWLVFNVWWDHTWCSSVSFDCFGVSLFSNTPTGSWHKECWIDRMVAESIDQNKNLGVLHIKLYDLKVLR